MYYDLTIKSFLEHDKVLAMRRRSLATIETVPLVGGRLCLDFTNTTGNRAGSEPRERLGSYADLLVFARRKELLDEEAARACVVASEADPEGAQRVLEEMIGVREAVYRVFLAAIDGRRPEESDLDLLNERQARAFAERRLDWLSGAPRWTLPEISCDLGQMTARIVLSAADLLTSEELPHLRKCGECDWLFLDQTKNHSRLWCKKACGDRVKARRYYRRTKERS